MADCNIMTYNPVRAEIFGKKPTAMQRLIMLRSWQTHTELQFTARHHFLSFSATTMEGSNCARFKQIGYSHMAERWDKVVVPMTDEQEDDAYEEAKRLEGMPYDTMGQLCHISKLTWWKPNPDKTWCTKAVAQCVYVARWDFYKFMEKMVLTKELRPDMMDMMARYYFGK